MNDLEGMNGSEKKEETFGGGGGGRGWAGLNVSIESSESCAETWSSFVSWWYLLLLKQRRT